MSVSPQSSIPAPLYTIKVLLLGESSVGKSSIVNRYTNHTFEGSGLLTIGIEVKKIMKQMAGKKVRLELWDTAGQEKYRTLPSQYYRGIQGILLVYDISNLESFKRIEEWFNKIEQNCTIEELVITLVGNKLDLEHAREVKSQTARNFAQTHKMKFKQTSAKTNINVEDTIDDLMEDIVRKGGMEIKQEKMVLTADHDKGRKSQNDTCCG